MNELLSFLKSFQDLMWGVPLLTLIVGVGLFLTYVLKGIQFRYFFRIFGLLKADKSSAQGDITPFQAIMTATASAVGTGSIVGVAVGICSGGLGAVFWMWVMGFIGMAVKYGESLLAVKYRVMDAKGEMSGGPMYFIERGLGWKWMGILYAVCAVIATLGIGNMVQVNSIAQSIGKVVDVDSLVVGVVLAVITALILLRGIKGIGFVSTVLVPVMAVFYVVAGVVVLFLFRDRVPEAFGLIISSAFTGQAAFGGFLGATVMSGIQQGVARSIFSSEAGWGISSIAAAAAKTTSSSRQALVSMAATVLSTAIICTVTALVVVVTGTMGKVDAAGKLINGAPLVMEAFGSAFRGGEYVVVIGLSLFAYTTIIAWAYYGEKCIEYLFGEKSVIWYRIAYIALIIPGAMFTLELIWSIADIMSTIIIIPTMIALFGLHKVIVKETNEFLREEALESTQLMNSSLIATES